MNKIIKIIKPDDWHVHLRDKELLKIVIPYTSKYFSRALIMPNLDPPITTIPMALEYKKRILNAIPNKHKFKPLMTCYLTQDLNTKILIDGYKENIFLAAKLYPFNTTTNSSYGVSNISKIYHIFDIMQKIKMPLLIHGEINDDNIDIFDREARFIDKIIEPIRLNFPKLKIVLEHISTKEAVEYILFGDDYIAATITPQHLMFNRTDMLAKNMNPHLYCCPILKSKIHQESLYLALQSGCKRFFLGSDTAPHYKKYKESSNVHAGIFSAPTALQVYITIFEKINALHYFESFCSINGPNFYKLPINTNFIELHKYDKPCIVNNVKTKKLVYLLQQNPFYWKVVV
ncbi:MAG: dihydroorotase [Enterobacterales bacterium]